MKKVTRRRKSKSAHLLGVGLDNEDGHKRLTSAEDFTIVGGSDETHGRMTETVMKTFEELKTRGKKLHAVEPQELAEIIHKSTPR
jgi:peroxiredoxin